MHDAPQKTGVLFWHNIESGRTKNVLSHAVGKMPNGLCRGLDIGNSDLLAQSCSLGEPSMSMDSDKSGL